MHSPYFKYVYNDDIEYITCTQPYRWIRPYYNKEQFNSIYGYTPKCYILDKPELQNTEEYNNLFITYPLVDLEPDRHPNFYKEYGEYLQEIFQFFKPKIKGKIIIIDNHDLPLYEKDILKNLGIEYDIILKKEYNSEAKETYDSKVYPFPYVVLGMNDCIYILNDKKIVNRKIDNRCFWSGSINAADEPKYYLKYDRHYWLNAFHKHIYNYPYNGSPNYGNEFYLKAMSQFKYSIYLKGYATLTRRFFEIMSTNSLMLIERNNIVFGFENQINFPEECIFSTIDELKEKYQKLETDVALYNDCLKIQDLIASNFFSYSYIQKHINNILENENSRVPVRVLQ